MSMTWDNGDPPSSHVTVRGMGWIRVALRASALTGVILAGLVALIPARMIERMLAVHDHAYSGWITVWVCRISLRLMGLKIRRRGTPMHGPGAQVANHTSWLDIFTLNSGAPLVFISKSEVAKWPGIGLLARATGTLFIARNRAQAGRHNTALRRRLQRNERLLFFPEGTSTDGRQVLPFKAPLFEAFLSPDLPKHTCIQPISLHYHAPLKTDDRLYTWWGKMEFGPHLLSILALGRHGFVEVVYHPPIAARMPGGRKALALAAEKAVRAGHVAICSR